MSGSGFSRVFQRQSPLRSDGLRMRASQVFAGLAHDLYAETFAEAVERARAAIGEGLQALAAASTDARREEAGSPIEQAEIVANSRRSADCLALAQEAFEIPYTCND